MRSMSVSEEWQFRVLLFLLCAVVTAMFGVFVVLTGRALPSTAISVSMMFLAFVGFSIFTID